MSSSDSKIGAVELVPCPGCGNTSLEYAEGEVTGLGKYIACQCGWLGPMTISFEEAARLWNQRKKTMSEPIGAVDGDKFLMRLIADQEHVLNTPQGRVWNEFVDMIKGWLKSKEFALLAPASLDTTKWPEFLKGISPEALEFLGRWFAAWVKEDEKNDYNEEADWLVREWMKAFAAGRIQPAPMEEGEITKTTLEILQFLEREACDKGKSNLPGMRHFLGRCCQARDLLEAYQQELGAQSHDAHPTSTEGKEA